MLPGRGRGDFRVLVHDPVDELAHVGVGWQTLQINRMALQFEMVKSAISSGAVDRSLDRLQPVNEIVEACRLCHEHFRHGRVILR